MRRKAITSIVVAAAIWAIGSAHAQQPAPAPKAIKIGVVDLGYVLTRYRPDGDFGRRKVPGIKPFRDEEEKLKKLIIDWQNALGGGKLMPDQVEQGNRTIADCKQRLEVLGKEYRKLVEESNHQEIVQLYKEVNDEVKRVAESQGFHLILGYGEAPNADLLSFDNVTRKMQAMDQGSAILTHIGCTDISRQVAENLSRARAAKFYGAQTNK